MIIIIIIFFWSYFITCFSFKIKQHKATLHDIDINIYDYDIRIYIYGYFLINIKKRTLQTLMIRYMYVLYY